FSIRIAIGDPIVFECLTPETICAWSVSIFIRPPRPKPCWRRQSSRLILSIDTGTPAGKPVSVATRHSPCDSPAVSKRSILGKFYVSENDNPAATSTARLLPESTKFAQHWPFVEGVKVGQDEIESREQRKQTERPRITHLRRDPPHRKQKQPGEK